MIVAASAFGLIGWTVASLPTTGPTLWHLLPAAAGAWLLGKVWVNTASSCDRCGGDEGGVRAYLNASLCAPCAPEGRHVGVAMTPRPVRPAYGARSDAERRAWASAAKARTERER